MTITPEQLVTYIRDTKIFNISQLEKAAGLSASTLAKAVNGGRGLPKKAADKVLRYFAHNGISPKTS